MLCKQSIYSISVFFILILLVACTGKRNDSKANLYGKLSPLQLSVDLDHLLRAIHTTDPDPYINCSQKSIDSLSRIIKGGLKDSMTVMEFYRLIRPLVSAFNDGHLSVFPQQNFEAFKKEGGKLFPYNVIIDNGKLFINDVQSVKNKQVMAGAPLLAVNGIPADKLISKLLTFFSGDSRPYKLKALEENFPVALWQGYGLRNHFKLLLGNGKTIMVTGVPAKPKPDNISTLKLLKPAQDQIALITLPSLVFESKKGFDKFLDSAFAVIAGAQIKRLIIDIRNNGGGSTLLARDVFNYITNNKYSLSTSEILYQNGKIVTLADTSLTTPGTIKNKFMGKTYLLMNADTYSSALMMANTFDYYKMGVTVGDSSAETRYISGEVSKVILPNSKLDMYCPSSSFVLPSRSGINSRLVPQYLIPLTTADKLGGNDRQLNFCLKLIAADE